MASPLHRMLLNRSIGEAPRSTELSRFCGGLLPPIGVRPRRACRRPTPSRGNCGEKTKFDKHHSRVAGSGAAVAVEGANSKPEK
jgi:hypothetical protein